jgi:Ni2+-binding GTPase involved in maturation of urease and hydrogenase
MSDDSGGAPLLFLGEETGSPELTAPHEDAEETLLQSESSSVLVGDGCHLEPTGVVVALEPLGRSAATFRSDLELLYEAGGDPAASCVFDEGYSHLTSTAD